jgi:hypothetical protein
MARTSERHDPAKYFVVKSVVMIRPRRLPRIILTTHDTDFICRIHKRDQ